MRISLLGPSGRCSRVVGRIAPSLWWLLFVSAAAASRQALSYFELPMAIAKSNSQLSAMDVSVRSTMKGAAKCDKHCELQNSVNRQGLERILCFWDIPESMPASVSMLCCSSGCCLLRACCCDCLCLRMCAGASEAFDQEGSVQQPAYQASLCADSCAVCGNCSVLLLCVGLWAISSSQDMKLGWQTR